MHILVRRFQWQDHWEYGPGWVPTFIKGADPTSGMGAAHDCLEHFPRCIGGFEGEMMAFGAMHFVRSHYEFGNGDIFYNTKSEMAQFLRAVMNGEQTLNDPGVVRGGSNYLDGDRLDRLVRDAVMECLHDANNGEDTNLAYQRRLLPRDTVERIKGWMLKGVLKAEKRYAQWGIQGWIATDLFYEVARQFTALRDGELGEIVKVCINFQDREVSLRRRYEY